MYYKNFSRVNIGALGFDEEGTQETIDKVQYILKIAESLKKFLGNLNFTNDNGIMNARGQIAEYVTYVLGDRDAAYVQLYKGFNLAASDINNVGTKSYYAGVLDRLNKAAINYIVNHAQESSKYFATASDPNVILQRYVKAVESGEGLGHAFWIAFTGKIDRNDFTKSSKTGVNLLQRIAAIKAREAGETTEAGAGTAAGLILLASLAGGIILMSTKAEKKETQKLSGNSVKKNKSKRSKK